MSSDLLTILKSQFYPLTLENYHLPDPDLQDDEKTFLLTSTCHDTIEFSIKVVFYPDVLKKCILTDKFIVNVTTKNHNLSPLLIAVKNGIKESVEILITHPEIDINLSSYYGLSPLMLALDHLEIFKLLISRPDIDNNTTNYEGQTVLHYACKNHNIECMKLLLSHPSVDVYKEDENDCNALELFYIGDEFSKEALEMFRYILTNYNLDIEDCLRNGNVEVLKIIIFHPKTDKSKLEGIPKYIYETENKLKELTRLRELDLGSILYNDSKKYLTSIACGSVKAKFGE